MAYKLEYKVFALGEKKLDKDGNLEDCKGTLALYGLTKRFPLALYGNQWLALAAAMPAIEKAVRQAIKEGKMAAEKPATTAANNTGRVTL